ncbi:hypothetical protein [Natronospora cellulosivora (SeqCode)]
MKKYFFFYVLLLASVFFLNGCSRYYFFEGYVIDFQTKEYISEAKFYFSRKDKTVMTNENGYFQLSGVYESFCPCCSSFASASDITAENYGTMSYWSLETTEIAKIPLMPPNSIYGRIYAANPTKVEVRLKGDTFDEITFCDENGDYYFLNVPEEEELLLYFYSRNDFNVLYDFREISFLDEKLIYHTVSEDNFY